MHHEYIIPRSASGAEMPCPAHCLGLQLHSRRSGHRDSLRRDIKGQSRSGKHQRLFGTLNEGYLLIRTPNLIFPGVKWEAVLQDFSKEKQQILDKFKKRLCLTKVHDFDTGLPDHIARTQQLAKSLEQILSMIILGTPVRQAFVAKYGQFRNGDAKVGKSHKKRRVKMFAIFYTNHIAHHFTMQQLNELRHVHEHLQISLAAIDELVAKGTRTNPMPHQGCRAKSAAGGV